MKRFERWDNGVLVEESEYPDTPEEIQIAEDATERESAKQSPVIQYLVTHTNAEIRQYVNNSADSAALKTIVGHLAVAVAVMARKELR